MASCRRAVFFGDISLSPAATNQYDGGMKNFPGTRYRALFLSDFHIGAKKFDAEALLDFLKKHDSDILYLVGDIIDGWKLKKRWYWTETISAIFDELARKAQDGTEIIYIPGNHDEAVRFLPLMRRLRFARRMGIQIKNKLVHETLAGKRLLVLHGDQFDRKIIDGPVSRLCDRLHDNYMELTGAYKKHMTIQIKGEEKPFSLAKFLMSQGQYALNALNNFEQALSRTVREEKTDGLICGHTHIPVLKILRGGILYANCGSWVGDKHTALAEDDAGQLVMIDWPHSSLAPPQLPRMAMNDDHQPSAYRPVTEKLVGSIQRTFTDQARQKAPGQAAQSSSWALFNPVRLTGFFLSH